MNKLSTINNSSKNGNIERETLRFDRLVWLFPLAFIIHFMEELPFFSVWVNETLGGTATNIGFVISNLVFMFILLVCCFFESKVKSYLSILLLFAWAGAQQYGNFVFHFYSQLLFNVYSPGVVSAVFIYNPLFLFLGYVAIREGRISKAAFVSCMVFGIVAMFIFAWANVYRFDPSYWNIWFPFW